ncbi:MAG: alginate export family protein [Verrucomicrobiota bacterium]
MKFPTEVLRNGRLWLIVLVLALSESRLALAEGLFENVEVEIDTTFRTEVESFENFEWTPDLDDTYYLQRLLVDIDLRFSDQLRFFAQPIHALSADKDDVAPPDEDRLDVQQLYLEWEAAERVRSRIGRQEFRLGKERLISRRFGPNVPRVFDGGRVTVFEALEDTTIDLFYLQEVRSRFDVFDNPVFSDVNRLWGLYSTTEDLLPGESDIDLYYLGTSFETSHLPFVTGNREDRYSFGSRIFGKNDSGFDWDLEGVFQTGTVGSRDIQAWTVASEIGFLLEHAKFTPRFALKTSISSGDQGDPLNGTIETFSPLFPKGDYFSESAAIGPYNHIELHPTLSLALSDKSQLFLQWNHLWRQSTDDAIYDVPGFPLRNGQTSDARYIGNEVSVTLDHQLTERISLQLACSHFVTGAFIEETGQSPNLTFGKISMSIDF